MRKSTIGSRSASKKPPAALIDRWILSLTQKLIADVEAGMEAYELNRAVEPLVGFVDQLTNWYIRRCRSRFWADADTPDRREAFETLYTVLLQLGENGRSIHPFLERCDLSGTEDRCDARIGPPFRFSRFTMQTLRDEELEKEVAAAQVAVSLGPCASGKNIN